jgi:DNA-binding transcriptional regulator YiaG
LTGAELQTARAALCLTQGALADCLGVSRRSIQHWEAGGRAVPETVARIMRLAQTDPELLTRLKNA